MFVKNIDMNSLTKAEEQVMHILWGLGEAFVKDVIEKFPEPKPAYNTISTIIRILEKKNIVNHNAFGRTHQYYAVLSKEEYTKQSASNLLNKYFSGSMEEMVSFFVKEKKMTVKDLEEIIHKIEKL